MSNFLLVHLYRKINDICHLRQACNNFIHIFLCILFQMKVSLRNYSVAFSQFFLNHLSVFKQRICIHIRDSTETPEWKQGYFLKRIEENILCSKNLNQRFIEHDIQALQYTVQFFIDIWKRRHLLVFRKHLILWLYMYTYFGHYINWEIIYKFVHYIVFSDQLTNTPKIYNTVYLFYHINC